MKGDILVCRCEEITENEVRKAVEDGATTVTGVKRRTRAGMGLCQGRTCEKIITRIIIEMTGQSPHNITSSTDRPPVRPVSFKTLGGGN